MIDFILNENVYMERIVNGKLEDEQYEHSIRFPRYGIFIKFKRGVIPDDS